MNTWVFFAIAVIGCIATLVATKYGDHKYALGSAIICIGIAVSTALSVASGTWPFFDSDLYGRAMDDDYTAIRISQLAGFFGAGLIAGYVVYGLYRGGRALYDRFLDNLPDYSPWN